MVHVKVSRSERARLETLAARGFDARVVQRAEAILWISNGETPEEVAERLLVSVQTVYNWIKRFAHRSGLPMSDRLEDARRSGRPPSALGIIDPLIAEVVDTSPEEYGYQTGIWTAPLLRSYLQTAHSITVSVGSISLAINRLRIRWKRPRHNLSRRIASWRQSKGGFSAG